MRRFRFPLEAVLRHRQALLRERQRDYAREQARVATIEQHIRSMRRSRREHLEIIRQAATGRLERAEMLRLRTYVNVLWLRSMAAARHLAEARSRADERRAELVRARQASRALEILKEKALRGWKSDADREERNFLDEIRPGASLLASPVTRRAEA